MILNFIFILIPLIIILTSASGFLFLYSNTTFLSKVFIQIRKGNAKSPCKVSLALKKLAYKVFQSFLRRIHNQSHHFQMYKDTKLQKL